MTQDTHNPDDYIIDMNALKHHGIMGMRWGVRRGRRVSERHGLGKPSRPKSPKELSNEQLKNAINRIELEKRYSQLTAKEKGFGRKFVEEILTNSARTVATAYVTNIANQFISTGKVSPNPFKQPTKPNKPSEPTKPKNTSAKVNSAPKTRPTPKKEKLYLTNS